MSLSRTMGFISYAHKDDTFGFLSNLAQDLRDEYKVLTGDDLELFFDRDNLKWGTEWEASIANGIDTAGIFLPVVSPCYFASSACMGELNQYLNKVKKSGATDLIMPLLYVDLSMLRGLDGNQMLDKLLSFQYKDINAMRFLERGSGAYVRYLNDLASGIYKAQESLEKAAISSVAASVEASGRSGLEDIGVDDENDRPFFLEAAAELPDKTMRMTESIEGLVKNIDDIGSVFNEGAGKVRDNCNPKDALTVLAGMSKRLDPLADDMWRNSEDFSALVVETDPLVRTVAEAKSLDTFRANDKSLGFDDLVINAEAAKSGIMGFRGVSRDAARLSRVLYKPLKKIERAAAICGNALDVVISWGDLGLGASHDEDKALGKGGEDA